MKIRKLIAGAVAAAMSLTAIAVGTSAALYEDELAANGAPTNNAYKLAGAEGVDYSKVAKIEAVVTTTDYVNGTIGVSANSEWITPGQLEATAGTSTWVLDGLTGIDGTLEDGTLKEDVVQVQFWWLNAGSFSLDSLKLFDADGNVLQEAGVDVAAPADTDAPTTDVPAVTYHAGIFFQTDSWMYRNDLTSNKVSEGAIEAPDYKVTDVEITADGTYTVEVSGIPADKSFHSLGLYTDIPGADEANMGKVKIISVETDGADSGFKEGTTVGYEDKADQLLKINLINEWNDDVKDSPAIENKGYSSIKITFTVEGLFEAPSTEAPSTEAPATEAPSTEAPATEAPATEAPSTEAPATSAAGDTNTTTPDKGNADTGVEGVAVVAGLAVVATLGVVIAKKRK